VDKGTMETLFMNLIDIFRYNFKVVHGLEQALGKAKALQPDLGKAQQAARDMAGGTMILSVLPFVAVLLASMSQLNRYEVFAVGFQGAMNKLTELEQVVDGWWSTTDPLQVPSACDYHSLFLTLHNHQFSAHRQNSWWLPAQSERPQTFLRKAAMDGNRPLRGLLVMPVQRLPRYALIFRELQKQTPKTFGDTLCICSMACVYRSRAQSCGNDTVDLR
jgi:hypothetical protein